ncbi:hypothetical protein [Candidatus Solincola tengchongensis]|uniref:hypothetical protein n=1 Tax=Candidatus Solincola tengchongensis TaxID=2900693 RepID=UPI00257D4969|nr:hypothetical protein [Candidatus Solincola tengchongensis]
MVIYTIEFFSLSKASVILVVLALMASAMPASPAGSGGIVEGAAKTPALIVDMARRCSSSYAFPLS